MPLGRKVGLGPVDFMLDGNPAPLPKERAEPPIFSLCLLWPNGWMDQDGIGMEVGLSPGNFVLDGDPAPPSQFSAHVYCGQTAGWIKMPLGRPQLRRHCVRYGRSSSPLKGHSPPQCSANVRCGQTARWTKMPLGMEVGLGQATLCSMGTQLPRKKGTTPTQFLAHVCCGQSLLRPDG